MTTAGERSPEAQSAAPRGRHQRPVLLLTAALLLATSRAEALSIDLSFGDGFDTGTRQSVAEAAAEWWEMSLLTPFTFDMTVDVTDGTNWTPTPNGAVGRMHGNTQTAAADPNTGTKLPQSGTVELNVNATWFWDLTPHDNSEFDMSREAGRFGDATDPSATGRWDALSVLKHEMGHALGFSRTAGSWTDGEPFALYDDFLNNFTGNDFDFDFLTSGAEGNKDGTGGALTQVRFDADSHIDGTGDQSDLNTKLMASPGFGSGQRSLQTPLDIDIIGDAFHLAIDDMPEPIPEPSSALLLAAGMGGLAALRRRGARRGGDRSRRFSR
jgi:hypothetical protein